MLGPLLGIVQKLEHSSAYAMILMLSFFDEQCKLLLGLSKKIEDIKWFSKGVLFILL